MSPALSLPQPSPARTTHSSPPDRNQKEKEPDSIEDSEPENAVSVDEAPSRQMSAMSVIQRTPHFGNASAMKPVGAMQDTQDGFS